MSPSFSRVARVAVIGGGPAGSVAAAWLAQQGIQPLVIERERFPRFHIGESLLPNGNGVLKAIGVWEKVQAAGFVEKRGAQFTLGDRSRTVRNVFSHGMVPGMEMAYQVERARFDEILLRHAEESGAEVWQETRVTGAKRTSAGWELGVQRDGSDGIVSADWVIDASGRACVMGRLLNLKKSPLPYPGRLAVFNHFEHVSRDAGEAGGDIIVIRLESAWAWSIPISDTVTSVGVVTQKGGRQAGEDLSELFWRKVGESTFLSQALRDATAMEDYRVESDYSFSFDRFGADRTLLAGDAASFIDPVFSSGVYLALESGLLAARSVSSRFTEPRQGDEERMYRLYTRAMKKRIGWMRQLVDYYYDNTSFEVLMTPRPVFQLPAAINSLLAGCLNPPWAVRWRMALFRRICALHKTRRLVPAIDWGESAAAEPFELELRQ